MLKVREKITILYKIDSLTDFDIPSIFGLYVMECAKDKSQMSTIAFIAQRWICSVLNDGKALKIKSDRIYSTYMFVALNDAENKVVFELVKKDELVHSFSMTPEELVDILNIETEVISGVL